MYFIQEASGKVFFLIHDAGESLEDLLKVTKDGLITRKCYNLRKRKDDHQVKRRQVFYNIL